VIRILILAILFTGCVAEAKSVTPGALPHVATDLAYGDKTHALIHFAENASFSTYSYGEKTAASFDQLLAHAKGCKPIKFAKMHPEAENSSIQFKCKGRPDAIVNIGGSATKITSALFYVNAIALTAPLKAR
jgi:hypothetical protein